MSANGKLRPEELTTVQGNIRLSNATARQYRSMAAAFKQATGFDMTISAPDGGYRDYATQAEMRADWYAKRYVRHNLSRTSKVPPAPAGESGHGWGTRVDVAIGSSWAIDHAHEFGFTREFGRDDPNHFIYNGITISSLNTTPVIEPVKDKHMAILIEKSKTGTQFLVREYSVTPVPDSKRRTIHLIYGDPIMVEDEQLKSLTEEVAAACAEFTGDLASGVHSATSHIAISAADREAIATATANEFLKRLKN